MISFNETTWAPDSWQKMKIAYFPSYDRNQVQPIVKELQRLAAIVSVQQIKNFQDTLMQVHHRKSFIVQLGDCAEPFEEKDYDIVSQKIDFMLRAAQCITKPYNPVVIGRIAGQYAKPRSAYFETINGVTLPAYQGDLINRIAFTPEDRLPNPAFMLEAYEAASEVIRHIRAVLSGKYESPQIYTSHEALQLFYEQGLTHCEEHGKWYNLSTHFPWLGMRTAIESDAHLEYLRGISNPIAIKLGPRTPNDRIIELINLLNPENALGKITLIHRLGTAIDTILPQWIRLVKAAEKNVIWCCDPMHGNTETTPTGIKTRRLCNIINEIEKSFIIHKDSGSFLAGIHLEVTPLMVTECIDDINIFECHLSDNYKSLVDPRLNPSQALQVMEVVNQYL